MDLDLLNLTDEELKAFLHNKNFKFNLGIEKGLSLDTLQTIRNEIRLITNEMERRNLVRFAQQSNPN